MCQVYVLLLLARATGGHTGVLLGLTGVARGHPVLAVRVLHLSLAWTARTHGSGARTWTWSYWTLSRSHTRHSSSHGHSDIIH